MNWSKRNAREKFLLVVCALALVIGVPLLLIPSYSGNSKLPSAAEARLKYQSTVKQKDSMSAETDRVKPALDKAAYTDRPEQLLPQVIRSLQDTAKNSGVHLREIKPLRPRRIGTLTKVPLSVRFTGTFTKTIPFLYRIEDPSGRLVVEKFNVTTTDAKSRTVDVEVQVALYTQQAGTGSDSGS